MITKLMAQTIAHHSRTLLSVEAHFIVGKELSATHHDFKPEKSGSHCRMLGRGGMEGAGMNLNGFPRVFRVTQPGYDCYITMV